MAKPNDLIATESPGLCNNSPKAHVTFIFRAEPGCYQEKPAIKKNSAKSAISKAQSKSENHVIGNPTSLERVGA